MATQNCAYLPFMINIQVLLVSTFLHLQWQQIFSFRLDSLRSSASINKLHEIQLDPPFWQSFLLANQFSLTVKLIYYSFLVIFYVTVEIVAF